jgi:hypothetical protein
MFFEDGGRKIGQKRRQKTDTWIVGLPLDGGANSNVFFVRHPYYKKYNCDGLRGRRDELKVGLGWGMLQIRSSVSITA